ncbi:MAG: class I SAM-dependent methyltransferase [Candidatus Omnitrophica bacterium]|nr:class I SAM-dependent methyltransferase [Candidatus Omnitrophota bacterium]
MRRSEVKNIALGAPIEYGYFGIQKRMEIILRNTDLKNANLLDAGCGNGAQTLEYLKHVKKCTAVDIEGQRLEEFRGQVQARGIDNCEIKQMDLTSLDLADEAFDVVTCIETLEHIAPQEKALDEMYRVLKKGGMLVLSVPNKWWFFETHGAKLPLLPWNRVPFFSWLPKKVHDKYAYARIYTKRMILGLVQNHGFKVYNSEYMMPPLDKIRIDPLRDILRSLLALLEKHRLMPRVFGVSIFVFARK